MESNFNLGLTISILLVIISFVIMITVRIITKKEMPHA
jgi:hypothetical protein